MISPAEKYKMAYEAGIRYRDAPRKGWIKASERKTKDNQTIEVPRKEAVELAESLASALYASYSRLHQNLFLTSCMEQIAKISPDAVECKKCHFKYLPDWMDETCPYCAAEKAATERVAQMLKDGQAGT